MQNSALGRFIAVAALAIVVGMIYLPKLSAGSTNGAPEYWADIDYWQTTKRRQTVTAKMPVDMVAGLDTIPLELGGWHGEDVPQTNVEVFILLEPEQYVQRRYRDDAGHIIWLTLIGSHKSRSFHPPDLCYNADGWLTDMASRAITLPEGGNLYGLMLDAQKGDVAQRSFYFYLMPPDDPTGVTLVRLTSPRYGSEDDTIALYRDFLSQLFRKAR